MMFEEFREHGLTDVELEQWLGRNGADHNEARTLAIAMHDEFVVIPIATISRLLGDQ